MGITWVIPALVSILLLGIVGLEQSAVGQGISFQQEEIDEIQQIITDMQDQLNNLHVQWGNVTAKPPGFDNATVPGIFQSGLDDTEPCDIGDVVTWTGIWDCLPISFLWENIQNKPSGFADNIDNDVLGTLECTKDQIAKWDGSQWVCANGLSGTSFNSVLEADLGSRQIENGFEVLYEFGILGLPSSNNGYQIPVNLLMLESKMNVTNGHEFRILLQEINQNNILGTLFLGVDDEDGHSYQTANHITDLRRTIEIESDTTKQLFRVVAQPIPDSAIGNFTNLKLKVDLSLPDGASLVPPFVDLAVDKTVEFEEGSTWFTITVTNKGILAATGVQLLDELPTGSSFVWYDTEGSGEFDTTTGVWDIGTIPPFETRTLNLEVSNFDSTKTNTATIIGLDQVDVDSSNDSATAP